MMKEKLAIIGASYLQIPLVIRAKKMGIETHCFAWEDGAVCKDVCDFFYPVSVLDKEEILRICKRIEITGITTIATDIAIPTICFVAKRLNLISNSIPVSLNATDKGKMRNQFRKHNVLSPKHIVLERYSVDSFETLSFPLIVKPIDRSGSRGINKVHNYSELEKGINLALSESMSKTAIVEEFIEGEEVSVESISWKGNHYILAVTDKFTTGEPNFVELAHHQPSHFINEGFDIIKDTTIKSLDSLGIENGAAHTELKIDNEGNVFVIEVGARMGGDFIGSHLVELSTGYDFLEAVILVALNRFEIPIISHRQYAGVYFLCEETKNILPYFYRENEFDVEKKINNEELKSIKNSNDRSGFLIYKSEKKVEF